MRKLYFGLQGDDVKELQEKLEQLGYANFTPTTFFGVKTHFAVRSFQKANNLPQTGVFGSTEASIMGIRQTLTNAELFFNTAMSFLGRDVTPQDKVDDDVACAETIDTIYKTCFGHYISGNEITISTLTMLSVLSNSPRFKRIQKPEKGAILLYATGTGGGYIKNGHIFLCGDNGLLYSNSSSNGRFEQNYNTFTARYRYETLGKYKPHYFMLT